jgi:hypothetical protein
MSSRVKLLSVVQLLAPARCESSEPSFAPRNPYDLHSCAKVNSIAATIVAGLTMLNNKTTVEPSASTTPTLPAAPEKQGCPTSFLTEQKDEIGKACKPSKSELKGQYVQPDEEKESGGEA